MREIIREIKSFIKQLLSESGTISSKRFAGFIALVNAVVLGYLKNVNIDVFHGFLWFAAAAFGLSVVDKFAHKKTDDGTTDTTTTETN